MDEPLELVPHAHTQPRAPVRLHTCINNRRAHAAAQQWLLVRSRLCSQRDPRGQVGAARSQPSWSRLPGMASRHRGRAACASPEGVDVGSEVLHLAGSAGIAAEAESPAVGRDGRAVTSQNALRI